jgi:hypothetical protein
MKMAVFWVTATCRLVRIYRRFVSAYNLNHKRDDKVALLTEATNTSKMSVNSY